MRATDAFASLAVEEVGVVRAPDEATCVLVDGVVDCDIAEIGHGQQTGHVGIVHKQMVAEAIDLVGIEYIL